MRIIQLLHSPGYGGAEIYTLLLMLGIREKGHDLIYAGSRDSWLANECRKHAIDVVHVRMRGMLDLASYAKLHYTIKNWRADIVHGHLIRASHFAGIATIGTKAVPISGAHATTAHKHMKRCRRIIAVSEAVKENLLRHNYPEEKIDLIYGGVPDKPRRERDSIRRELNIAPGVFAVACVGRFVRDKGQDLLLEALEKLPNNAHLFFLGATETEFGQAVVKRFETNSRVHFLGFRSDVNALLPGFDAYVAPSRREALSLALLEAAAARLPLVGAKVGGIPEVISEGENGLLFPAEDAAGIAEALNRLIKDPVFAVKLGESARRRYEEKFTVEQLIQNTLCTYEAALA